MKTFEDLQQRGLIKQITNVDKISNLLNNEKIIFYIGFDPTSDSLHIGHLLQLITARRLTQAGHTPIMLLGGATAMIGDPTGKTEMRKVLTQHTVANNGANIVTQIDNMFDPPPIVINNIQWFKHMDFLTVLREVGSHFSVNNMLRAECFKSRMEHGLSFLEFNYMIMQAFDFLHLFKAESCALQIGGDDQWSNILAGIDLIHKKEAAEVFGLTLPLLISSSGQKIGKTENNAIWLDANKTSVFDFFQFWRNLPDEDVMKCFKQLTFLSLEDIYNIPFSSVHEMNAAKKVLAFEITKLVHGEFEAVSTLKQVESLFEQNNISDIQALEINNNINVLDLVVKAGFAKSRTDARNLINGHGISINNNMLDNPTLIITSAQFGNEVVVKKGKKNFKRFLIKDGLDA